MGVCVSSCSPGGGRVFRFLTVKEEGARWAKVVFFFFTLPPTDHPFLFFFKVEACHWFSPFDWQWNLMEKRKVDARTRPLFFFSLNFVGMFFFSFPSRLWISNQLKVQETGNGFSKEKNGAFFIWFKFLTF
jgi:hypothetical protein